ncbi:MAG: GNAT family protein [Pseudomonadota bacterium]
MPNTPSAPDTERRPLPPGWQPPRPPSRESLTGRTMRLEPLLVDHAEALHAANTEDDAIWHWLPYGPFADVEAYRDWLRGACLAPDPLFYAVVVEGKALGVASYLRIAPEAGSIEIGHICLSKRLQRTPAATEALTALIGWAFEAGYRRLEWKCDALNQPSRRAALRLGLSFEGVFRQATHTKGYNRDTAWYAAIDGEWPALRTAYTEWLATENFDTEGRQRQRLSDLTAPVLVARG